MVVEVLRSCSLDERKIRSEFSINQQKTELPSRLTKACVRCPIRQRYQLGRKLGEGTYGSVRIARDRHTNKLVAIKSISLKKLKTKQEADRVREEVDIMKNLDHPNILKLYDVIETDTRIALVLEYAPRGELFDRLMDDPFDHADNVRWLRQIAEGLRHCHDNGIVHRDLKLENILLDENNNVKICDFGLATRFDPTQRLSTFCGSALYASPEVISGLPYIGPEIDCWSLGVVAFALVHGCMPFGGNDPELLRAHITGGVFSQPEYMPGISEIIDSLLQPNYKIRYTVHEVLAHPWVKQPIDEKPKVSYQTEKSSSFTSESTVSCDSLDSPCSVRDSLDSLSSVRASLDSSSEGEASDVELGKLHGDGVSEE